MREDGWITKREAATLAGVDERTIERKARAGKIASKGRPGFPTFYRQADVEIVRQAGREAVQTGLLETGAGGNGNGHRAVASLRSPALGSEAWFVEVLQALRAALTHPPIGPTGPTTGPTAAYVAKAEALALSGVSDDELRRAVKAGEVKMRGRRYRRKDLEAL